MIIAKLYHSDSISFDAASFLSLERAREEQAVSLGCHESGERYLAEKWI